KVSSLYDPDNANTTANPPADDPRLQKPEGLFICPSGQSASAIIASGVRAATHYRWNHGDAPFSQDGITASYETIAWQRGLGGFGKGAIIDFGSITDGLSNTAMFSERMFAIALTTNNYPVIEICILSTDANGGSVFSNKNEATILTNRQTVLDYCGTNGNYKNSFSGVTSYRANYGYLYYDALAHHSGFHTVLPPNGPAAVNTNSRQISVLTPTSNHKGGVNLAKCDGSVTFITNASDTGTAATIAAATTADAPSPFGIWGALGTRCGGESQSP
ncbi:MAG: DUF1559 domain-containing protein, partial [Planctomycetaceae bacterium]|nr:DUF1559 domain-containing protein [Planctomycetaceae bacterium]